MAKRPQPPPSPRQEPTWAEAWELGIGFAYSAVFWSVIGWLAAKAVLIAVIAVIVGAILG